MKELPEGFRWVSGCEGNLCIKEDGSAWSTARGGMRKLKPYEQGGKLTITAYSEDGVTEKKYLHRLVAETWVDNPDGFFFAKPKDGDYTNTHPENLVWNKTNGSVPKSKDSPT